MTMKHFTRLALSGCAAAMALTFSAFAYDTGVTTDDGLRLRSEPSTSASIRTILPKGQSLSVLEVLEDWYKVDVNGTEGYVFADFVDVDHAEEVAEEAVEEAMTAQESSVQGNAAEEETAKEEETVRGIVTGGTINVRKGPSTDYEKITTVRTGKAVVIEGSENGWYKVSFDGVTGYILGKYVREAADGVSSVGAQAAALAYNYLGVPYVWGGSSPKGFDCSGLTMYLYQQYGYSLPHGATAQYNNSGSYVAKADLEPGDLVFFSQGSYSIGHAGIYIGNGEFIHARASTGRVQIDRLDASYYMRHYVGAKRIG